MPEPSILSAVPAPAGWTAVAILVIWLGGRMLRQGQDTINQYKAGSVFADGMDSLHVRVNQMDARISRLERDKSKLIVYCTKVLTHFSGCGGCKRTDGSRSNLQAEFDTLMEEVNQ